MTMNFETNETNTTIPILRVEWSLCVDYKLWLNVLK